MKENHEVDDGNEKPDEAANKKSKKANGTAGMLEC